MNLPIWYSCVRIGALTGGPRKNCEHARRAVITTLNEEYEMLSVCLFWFSLLFVAYTYVGYPMLIFMLSKSKPLEPLREPEQWPTVGLIIPVHNEAENLRNKICSLQEIDYPKDKLTITFVSDGSEDETNAILEADSSIKSVCYQPRQGKPTALNKGIEAQNSEIVVFTDARQTIAPSAIKRIVARLLSEQVGAVSGEIVHYGNDSKVAKDVGLYWRYEKWIRAAESRYFAVPGVSGALYAMRRKDVKTIPSDTLLDDFEIPIQVLRQKKRILLETGAIAYDTLHNEVENEKTRKVRTLAGNFQAFSRNSWLFSRRRNPIYFQFLSHKVFRLLVPYGLIIMAIIPLTLDHWFYSAAFFGQLGFYSLALAAKYSVLARRFRIVSFSSVFFELNYAAIKALYIYLIGSVDVKWKKTA